MSIDDYNECVDLHADGVYRFMLKHVRDTEKARDLVQEAFAKMWVKVDEIDGKKL
jgi:RNA polymerase sigma-70 factor (ECF subfamily)